MRNPAYRRRVTYQHAVEYDVLTTENVFDPANPTLLSIGRNNGSSRFVVVDSNVYDRFGSQIHRYFSAGGVTARVVTLPGGEATKSLERFTELVTELDSFPIDRREEPIVVVGGGVLTDLVGFVAGSYRRGIPYIRVPTTLMGYVDASIGIKSGINFNGNKNRLGSFVAPAQVVLDRTLLKTLSPRHVRNGVCEIVKLAVIKDSGLFRLLEKDGVTGIESRFQAPLTDEILERSIEAMLDELEPNLMEQQLARKVDFGHTFSYGLETRCEADLLHGEAVLLDIVLSSRIAAGRSLLSSSEWDRLLALVSRLELPLRTDLLYPQVLSRSLRERTYHRSGSQRVPLPNGLGTCAFVNDITEEELHTAVRALQATVAV